MICPFKWAEFRTQSGADLARLAQISGDNFVYSLFNGTAEPECPICAYTGIVLFFLFFIFYSYSSLGWDIMALSDLV